MIHAETMSPTCFSKVSDILGIPIVWGNQIKSAFQTSLLEAQMHGNTFPGTCGYCGLDIGKTVRITRSFQLSMNKKTNESVILKTRNTKFVACSKLMIGVLLD